jgi:hypothetical protein
MVYISYFRVVKDTSRIPFFGSMERDPATGNNLPEILDKLVLDAEYLIG